MDCGLPHGAQVAQGQAVEQGLGSCSHRWVPSFCISQSSVVHEHPGPCSCGCLPSAFPGGGNGKVSDYSLLKRFYSNPI